MVVDGRGALIRLSSFATLRAGRLLSALSAASTVKEMTFTKGTTVNSTDGCGGRLFSGLK